MFAIIEISGRQIKVAKGDKITVDQMPEKEGATVNIEEVLLLSNNGKTLIGTPAVEGAFVTAKVLGEKKGDKVTVFKMKAKKRYQKKIGFRAKYTILEITDIKESGAKKETKTETASEEPAKKPAKKAPAKRPAKA